MIPAGLAVSRPEIISYTEGIQFIQEGLSKNAPVALLNTFNVTEMSNSTESKDSTMHWVTITQIEYNQVNQDFVLTVSSWGNKYTMSYNELYESWISVTAIESGMVYFELEE